MVNRDRNELVEKNGFDRRGKHRPASIFGGEIEQVP
jgi:hypothetical protein